MNPAIATIILFLDEKASYPWILIYAALIIESYLFLPKIYAAFRFLENGK